MAVVNNSNNGTKSTQEKKKADGFLNVSIKMANGTVVKVNAVIPLYSDGTKMEKSLLNLPADREVQLVGTVYVVPEDDGQDLEFA